MKDDYTFVTLDNEMVTTGDAVFVDVDDAVESEFDFVSIDESQFENKTDFITFDDMYMINDMDIDSYVSDISEADVTIIL